MWNLLTWRALMPWWMWRHSMPGASAPDNRCCQDGGLSRWVVYETTHRCYMGRGTQLRERERECQGPLASMSPTILQ